jgi:hypothetical protein
MSADEDQKPAPRGITDPEEARRAAEAQRTAEVEPTVDVMPRAPAPAEHIGDGVYASFDGYHVNLAVNDHRNHAVALDPYVLADLIKYAQRVGALR